MSNIPQARALLETALEYLHNKQMQMASTHIKDAIELMHRKKHKTVKSRNTATPVNKHIRDLVKQLVIDQPDINVRTVGEIVNINQGRVSEILEGKYDKLG
tara:strand:+ start:4866 stop:5168 length:303 start_codon:yes stop_codon:yes gene_type:complete